MLDLLIATPAFDAEHLGDKVHGQALSERALVFGGRLAHASKDLRPDRALLRRVHGKCICEPVRLDQLRPPQPARGVAEQGRSQGARRAGLLLALRKLRGLRESRGPMHEQLARLAEDLPAEGADQAARLPFGQGLAVDLAGFPPGVHLGCHHRTVVALALALHRSRRPQHAEQRAARAPVERSGGGSRRRSSGFAGPAPFAARPVVVGGI
mmetsp:Transcript_57961/g.152649  ORF Transcript_57961/g.152649 Transcript_57961/m.152649 type:complete len:211 (-) Transcript_57961:754-1386(-)